MMNEKNTGPFPNYLSGERAGRAVVRAVTHRAELSEVLVIPLEEGYSLDTELAEIDIAQKIGLETGDLKIIGTRA